MQRGGMEGAYLHTQAAVWAGSRAFGLCGGSPACIVPPRVSTFAVLIVCASYIALSLASLVLSYAIIASQQSDGVAPSPTRPKPQLQGWRNQFMARLAATLTSKQALINETLATALKSVMLGELTVMGLSWFSGHIYSIAPAHMCALMLLGLASKAVDRLTVTTMGNAPSSRFEMSSSLARSLWKNEHVVLQDSMTGSQIGAFAKYSDLIGTFTDSNDPDTARPSPCTARPALHSVQLPEIDEHAYPAEGQEQPGLQQDQSQDEGHAFGFGASPAEVMLNVLQRLTEGQKPDLKEVQLLQDCLREGRDLYTPPVDEEVVVTHMDADVEEALMQRLLGLMPAKAVNLPLVLNTDGISVHTSNVDGLLTNFGAASMAFTARSEMLTSLRERLATLMCECSPLDVPESVGSLRTARRSSSVCAVDDGGVVRTRVSTLSYATDEMTARRSSLDPGQFVHWKARTLLCSEDADSLMSIGQHSADDLAAKSVHLITNGDDVSAKSVFAASEDASTVDALASAGSQVKPLRPGSLDEPGSGSRVGPMPGRPSREGAASKTPRSPGYGQSELSAVAEDGPAALGPIPAKDISAAFGSTIAISNLSVDLAAKTMSFSGAAAGMRDSSKQRRGSVEFFLAALRDHSYGFGATSKSTLPAMQGTTETALIETSSDTHTVQSDLMHQGSSDISSSGRKIGRGSAGSNLPPPARKLPGMQPSNKRRSSSSTVEGGDKTSGGIKRMSSKIFSNLFNADSKKSRDKMTKPSVSIKLSSHDNLQALEAAAQGADPGSSKGALDSLASAISGRFRKLQSRISRRASRRGQMVESKPTEAVIEAMTVACRSLSESQGSHVSKQHLDTKDLQLLRRAKSMSGFGLQTASQLSTMRQDESSTSRDKHALVTSGGGSSRLYSDDVVQHTNMHTQEDQDAQVSTWSSAAANVVLPGPQNPAQDADGSALSAPEADANASAGQNASSSEHLSATLMKLQPGQASVISITQQAWVSGAPGQAENMVVRSAASSVAGYMKLSDISSSKACDDTAARCTENAAVMGPVTSMLPSSSSGNSPTAAKLTPQPSNLSGSSGPASQGFPGAPRARQAPRRAGTESRIYTGSSVGSKGSAGLADSLQQHQQQQQQMLQTRQSRAALAQRILDSRPSPAMLDEVETVLASADSDICFDAFKLAKASANNPLSTLAFFLMHRANLINTFSLAPVKLARWLRHMEKGYLNNPYHNSTHAADVLQTLHVTIAASKMQPHYVDSHCLLSCYLAAIMHDFEHRGLTNDYLISTADALAIRYNDKAPMENHHLAAGFAAMRTPGLDFAAGMNKDDYDKMRKIIIELVLATDMKQHFHLLAQYNGTRRQWAAVQAMAGRHAQAEASQSSDPPGSSNGLHATRPSGLGRGSANNSLPSPRHGAATRLSVSPPVTSTGIAVRSSLQHSGSLSGLVRHTPRSGGLPLTLRVADLSTDTQPVSRVPSSPITCPASDDHVIPAASHHSLLGSGSSFDIRTSEASYENRGSKPNARHSRLDNKTSKWLDSKLSLNGSMQLSTTRMSRMLEGYEHYSQEEVVPIDEQERMLSIQIAFKCSDLGHIAESRDVHLKWVAALEEEFFRQGDAERAAGLPISPLFDRTKPGVTKSQVGFFEVVTLPLFKAFAESFPGAKPLLAGVVDNYKHWKLQEKEKAKEVAP